MDLTRATLLGPINTRRERKELAIFHNGSVPLNLFNDYSFIRLGGAVPSPLSGVCVACTYAYILTYSCLRNFTEMTRHIRPSPRARSQWGTYGHCHLVEYGGAGSERRCWSKYPTAIDWFHFVTFTLNVINFSDTGPIQCGCWWHGALAPGHQ